MKCLKCNKKMFQLHKASFMSLKTEWFKCKSCGAIGEVRYDGETIKGYVWKGVNRK